METKTISKEEFDFIKNINIKNYSIDNIDKDKDPIYKKLSELYITNKTNLSKIKRFINTLVEDLETYNSNNSEVDKIEFHKFVIYIYTNFIKILTEENELGKLDDLNLFSFFCNESLVEKLQTTTESLINEFIKTKDENIKNFIIELCENSITNKTDIIKLLINEFVNTGNQNIKDITIELYHTAIDKKKITEYLVDKFAEQENENIKDFIMELCYTNKLYNEEQLDEEQLDAFYTKQLYESILITDILTKKFIQTLNKNIGNFITELAKNNFIDIENIFDVLIDEFIKTQNKNIINCIIELNKNNLILKEELAYTLVFEFIETKDKDIEYIIYELNKSNLIFKHEIRTAITDIIINSTNKTKYKNIIDCIIELNKIQLININKITKSLINEFTIYKDENIKNFIIELGKDKLINEFYITKLLVNSFIKTKNETDKNYIKDFIFECNNKNLIDEFLVIDTITNTNTYNKTNARYLIEMIDIDIFASNIMSLQEVEQLLKIMNEKVENIDIKKDRDIKTILCARYISQGILINKNSINNFKCEDDTILQLFNEVLERQENNKIAKIDDLTIKEIKTLFNSLMEIQFNQTVIEVDGNNIAKGPFLQVIISLAENSEVNEDITIGELFNTQKENKLAEIQEFQTKINNFNNIEITEDTKIENIEDFIKILGLKESDFNKPGFKTFEFDVPEHTTTIVIDTSKSYEEFIKNNQSTIKDIILIDSSHALNWMMDTDELKFSNQKTQEFIHKIPVPNNNYQENGTCWGNATCANSALLNNYKNFDEIVERDENGEIIGLQDGVEENIINETSKYYVSNVNMEIDKKKYYNVKQTKLAGAEFRKNNSDTLKLDTSISTNYDNYSIKSNIKQEQLFQKPLEVFKAQQFELKNKKPTEEEKLKKEKEELEKLLNIDTELNSIKIDKNEEFDKKYQEYKQNKIKFKKLQKRLDLIIDKKLDHIPSFGREEKVKNFRCYTNSKNANNTILSFDMYMGSENKKVSVKFILKDTDILKFNTQNLINLEEEIKTNGLESCLKENCEIKVKTEELKNYVDLAKSHHKNRICEMVKSDVGLHIK